MRVKSTVIGHDCNDHIRDTAATKNTGHDIPLY